MNLNQAQHISEFPPNPFFGAPICCAESILDKDDEQSSDFDADYSRCSVWSLAKSSDRLASKQATTDYDEQNQKATHLNTNTLIYAVQWPVGGCGCRWDLSSLKEKVDLILAEDPRPYSGLTCTCHINYIWNDGLKMTRHFTFWIWDLNSVERPTLWLALARTSISSDMPISLPRYLWTWKQIR